MREDEVTGSPLFREVAAAHDWGVDLARWFALPPGARAMMIAYSEAVADAQSLLTRRWQEQSQSLRLR